MPHSYSVAEFDLFQGFDLSEAMRDVSKDLTDLYAETTSTFTTETLSITEASVTTSVVQNARTPLMVTVQHTHETSCQELEQPVNIGPFEVPTQLDLVLHIRNMILKLYRTYKKQTLALLRDIKHINRLVERIEKKCSGRSKLTYKWCVKQVSEQCEETVKSLVHTLEHYKNKITIYTNDKICNITSMPEDPRMLMKLLANEKVALNLKLPGFLRMLGGCSTYCRKNKQITIT